MTISSNFLIFASPIAIICTGLSGGVGVGVTSIALFSIYSIIYEIKIFLGSDLTSKTALIIFCVLSVVLSGLGIWFQYKHRHQCKDAYEGVEVQRQPPRNQHYVPPQVQTLN